jgi:hypothetical protein
MKCEKFIKKLSTYRATALLNDVFLSRMYIISLALNYRSWLDLGIPLCNHVGCECAVNRGYYGGERREGHLQPFRLR